MTEQQTAEAKIIAGFMGGEIASGPFSITVYKFDTHSEFVSELAYHTDWNWLMAVWQKFRDVDKVKLGSNFERYAGYHLAISSFITDNPTPSAAASLLSHAIIWIESLKK